MALADTFQAIVDSLPDDWTDLELDMRLADESRYVEASLYLTTCNARPYSKHDWHWRLLVAHHFGHAAAAETVWGTLKLLDDAGIPGELVLREVREGRAEVVPMWGRGESFREDFQRLGLSYDLFSRTTTLNQHGEPVLAFVSTAFVERRPRQG